MAKCRKVCRKIILAQFVQVTNGECKSREEPEKCSHHSVCENCLLHRLNKEMIPRN